MSRCHLLSYPGREWELEWVADESAPIPAEVTLAGKALDALGLLGEIVRPLALELELACSDPETRAEVRLSPPSRRFWLLRASRLPAGVLVEPGFVGTQVARVPACDRAAALAWIARALREPCAEGTIATWIELAVRACEARLPEEVAASGRGLTLVTDTGEVDVPVAREERGSWVAGPLASASTGPPLEVRFHNEGGVIRMRLCARWSIWGSEGQPGLRRIDDLLGRLGRGGWGPIDREPPAPR